MIISKKADEWNFSVMIEVFNVKANMLKREKLKMYKTMGMKELDSELLNEITDKEREMLIKASSDYNSEMNKVLNREWAKLSQKMLNLGLI